MDEHIAEFVAEHNLSDETEASLVSTMEEAMGSLGEVFRSIKSGEIEREDARDDMADIRDDMTAALTELLGPEQAEQFQENMRGPLAWRGPRGR